MLAGRVHAALTIRPLPGERSHVPVASDPRVQSLT